MARAQAVRPVKCSVELGAHSLARHFSDTNGGARGICVGIEIIGPAKRGRTLVTV